jgi:tRNA(His) guanylyltransferase
MKFEELEARMRVYETIHDQWVLPGIHMVARLDGRGFTHLTRDVHHFEAPYDIRFRDVMVDTVGYLVAESGFQVIYGYTQSDEISLLFHPEENTFSRKIRKFNSILARECSAKFSLLLGDLACFDCRISQLPLATDVVDYFRWRSEDAHRNALNGHCYWILRKEGVSVQTATHSLSGLSIAEKNEFLFRHGINFNDLPNWQKRGVGVYWEDFTKEGWNPQTPVTAQRRRRRIDYDLPMRDEYDQFIRMLLETSLAMQSRQAGDPVQR